jgi:uncharacterized protein YciI
MKLATIVLLFVVVSSTFGQTGAYSFVFLHKKSDAVQMPPEQLKVLMEGHMANITRLAKEGKLIAAGPFEGGGGMFILNTTSSEEATLWLSTDPGVQAQRWDIEILPYTPRIRSVCAVTEPYEMVAYNFVRFKVAPSKQDNQSAFAQHENHLKQLEQKGNVVTEGVFGKLGGGIVVMSGELNTELLEADPAVHAGIVTLDVKKLWIAKGSFCEK